MEANANIDLLNEVCKLNAKAAIMNILTLSGYTVQDEYLAAI